MTSTTRIDRVNILLVDDQPAKLLVGPDDFEQPRRDADHGELGD